MSRLLIRNRLKAFTLIEVLAAMAVLLILMLALVRIFSEAGAASQKANVTVKRNAAARVALEMLRDDLQGVLVDQKLAMYSQGNAFDNNFDRIGFITLRKDPDSENNYAYLQVQYYVTNDVMTNSSIVYTNKVLMRSTRTMETARRQSDPIDALALTGKQWWKNQEGFDPTPVVDNVIRFDVWVCHELGTNLTVKFDPGWDFGGGILRFDSSRDSRGNLLLADQPPAYIDVYLQVTSDDAMKRGTLALAAGQTDEAYATLYRESNVLVTRIAPPMWAAERIYPLGY